MLYLIPFILFLVSFGELIKSVKAIKEFSPYHYGNYIESLASFNVGTHRQPATNSTAADMHIYIVSPNCTIDTSMPIFYFFTAFAGKVPSVFYNEFLRHIASHGVVVVSMDSNEVDKKVSFQKDKANELIQLMDWFSEDNQLTNLLSDNQILNVQPDYTKIFLGGHSAGGHTVTQVLDFGCNNVGGLILIDPVDGLTPFNYSTGIENYASVIHPPRLVNFRVPLLHIDNALDPVNPFPMDPTYPPCAPAEMSNDRFFDAWRAPAWQINATYFGHMDFVDIKAINKLNNVFDFACAGNKTADNREYISLVGGGVVAFIDMIYNKQTSSEVYLIDAKLMPTPVTLRQNMNGFVLPLAEDCVHLGRST